MAYSSDEENAYIVERTEYSLYKSRFFMLTIYSLIGMFNNAIWVAYTPIVDKAHVTYDVSTNMINFLAATYLAATVLLTPLGMYICDKKGARWTVLICGALNTVGAWIKFGSGIFDDPHTSFMVVFIGQTFCACAQPLFLPVPPKLAAYWFGQDERTIATGIGSLAVVAGIAVGFGMSIGLQGDEEHCCGTINLVLAICVTIPSVTGLFFYRERPPTPPTASADAPRDNFLDSFKSIIKETSFVTLMCTISPGYGLITALFSLEEDLIAGAGYGDKSEFISGILGVVLVCSGLVGAIIFGGFLDENKKFKEMVRIAFLGAMAGMVSLVIVLQLTAPEWSVFLTCGIAGFFLLALLPMCIEYGCEVTYPATESVVAGTLLLMGNLWGLFFFFIMTVLIYPVPCEPGQPPSNLKTGECENSSISLWFFMFVGVSCWIGSFFIHGEYKRLNFEAKNKEEAEIENQGIQQGGYGGVGVVVKEDNYDYDQNNSYSSERGVVAYDGQQHHLKATVKSGVKKEYQIRDDFLD